MAFDDCNTRVGITTFFSDKKGKQLLGWRDLSSGASCIKNLVKFLNFPLLYFPYFTIYIPQSKLAILLTLLLFLAVHTVFLA